METYAFATRVGGGSWNHEVFASPGSPYFEGGAVFSIMNKVGSDRRVRLKRLSIAEIGGRTTTTVIPITAQRITALTGGEDLAVLQFDTEADALPSQVRVVRAPGSITTSGATLRSLQGGPRLGTARNPFLAALSLCGKTFLHRINPSSMMSFHDANIQGQVLREGEGLALRTNLLASAQYRLQVSVWFSTAAGDTYYACEVLTASSGSELLAVMNGSGSGVVLTLGRIEVSEIRTDDALALFTLETISGSRGGDTVTLHPMDTANTLLPASNVDIVLNAGVTQANVDALQMGKPQRGGDAFPLRRKNAVPFGISAGLASGMVGGFGGRFGGMGDLFRHGGLRLPADSETQEIVLQEGDGIALLQKVNAGGYGDYEITGYVCVEDTGSGGGGGNTYSRSRVVNA